MLNKTGGGGSLDPEVARFLDTEAEEHRLVFDTLMSTLAEPFGATLELWHRALRDGGKLLLFGNGGSAGNAQHIAAELVVRYEKDRAAIAAIALTADSLMLTAAANDSGIRDALQPPGRSAWAARAMSPSACPPPGAAPTCWRRCARRDACGLQTSGLIGGDGGPMRALCDAAIVVPSRSHRHGSRRCTCWSPTCCARRWRAGWTAGGGA